MIPVKQLQLWLSQHPDKQRYLFTVQDLRSLFADLSKVHFKTLLSRAVKQGLLQRVCRNIYLNPIAAPKDGRLLFHTAALLRANMFNYISLETVLSEAGVISQIPHHWISLMSSGRTAIIDCGDYGQIEFIHTKQLPAAVMDNLHYDAECGLWRANVEQALRDMRATQRPLDLINKDML